MMHTYDVDSAERRNGWLATVIPSVLMGYGLFVGVSIAGQDWLWIVGIPSPLAVLGALYLWMDRWGWRNRLIRKVVGIRTPDLTGLWKGSTKSIHESTTTSIVVKIDQTWSRIQLRSETDQSRSTSETASLLLTKGGEPILIYTYLNEPKALASKTMQTHRGTATCYLDAASQCLDGDYYTGRGRRTSGSLSLQRS